MTLIDHIIVAIYLFCLFGVTYQTIRQQKLDEKKGGLVRNKGERHFLASRNASALEATFSIVATEFSSLSFVQIPALVMIGQINIIWNIMGIIIGRYVISTFLLKNFYRSGITIFESFARGVKNYSIIYAPQMRAQQFLATIYFFAKLLSISGALYLGAKFIAEFYKWDYLLVLILIVILTFTYTVTGGLKVVMRTDIIQFIAIIAGGATILYEFMSLSYVQNQHHFFNLDLIIIDINFDLKSIILGLISGFILDFTTHGIEQDYVQKLKACKTPKIAIDAIKWSTVLTILIQLLFLIIGASFISSFGKADLSLNEAANLFIQKTFSLLGPGQRGIVAVAILSAAMSSLDSSLNALSSVLWNDILPQGRQHLMRFFIVLDNIIVTLFITLFAYFVDQHIMYLEGFIGFYKYILLPVVCCFLIRFVGYPWMNFSFNFHTIIFTILSCFFGWLIGTFYLQLPGQLIIFSCLIVTVLTIQLYEKIKLWI